jgi:hypothetical protein
MNILQSIMNNLRSIKASAVYIWTGQWPPLPPDPPVAAGPTQPLRPIPVVPPKDRTQAGLQICIDFGTSASAVTWVVGARDHRFAILAYGANHEKRLTIGSSVLWMNEDVVGEEALIMGSDNYRGVWIPGSGQEISRSFKRLLFDFDMLLEPQQARIRKRLRAILRELLLLALAPRHSSTIAELRKHDQSGNQDLDWWSAHGGFGLDADAIQAKLLKAAEVCLCVPNSFGAQSIEVSTTALKEALADIANRYTELANLVAEGSSVRVVREAEAVAWAAFDEIRERQRVLILDVGAGTTDVAVVESTSELPRLRMRSGIPFGGDDVDQLLLVLATQQAEEQSKEDRAAGGAAADVVALETVPPGSKASLVNDARLKKESWSASQNASIPTLMPDIPYLVRTSQVPEAYTTNTRIVADAEREERYRTFLRYAISATCAPLLNELRDNNLTLGSVILSGSSSALPQVRQTVQALLASVEMPDVPIHSISERLASPPAFKGISEVQRAKLACAWGAAESSRDWEHDRDLRQYVPETIKVIHNDRPEEALFEAGMVFAHGELTQYRPLNPNTLGHTLLFYRYFCVPSNLIEEEQQTSAWLRRLVGRVKLHYGTCGIGVRLTLSNRAPSFHESLDTWHDSIVNHKKMIEYRPDVLPQPPGDNEHNPVTGLPMSWAWFS